MKTTTIVLAAAAAAALLTTGCHRTKQYEATVEIDRLSVVRVDEAGHRLTTDLAFSYVECPGDQEEVLRGGKEFSECIAKHKVGDKVKVKVVHAYDPEGFYDYDVIEVDGCKRPPDPHDEASNKEVRECSDWVVHGATVGFQCMYTDKKELNKKCPWFKKH